MDLEQHVPSLETCKRLKEAGFPQETHFLWRNHPGTGNPILECPLTPFDRELFLNARGTCAAPILTEILEQLPKSRIEELGRLYPLSPQVTYNGHYWYVQYVHEMTGPNREDEYYQQENKNPAESAALLWLELHEKEAYERSKEPADDN